jgi:hypothetical protein
MSMSFRDSGVRTQARIAAAPFHRWLTPDARPWTLFYRIGDRYVLRFPGFADFEVSRDGMEIAGWRVDGISDATITQLYLNQVLPLALSRRGAPVLHASAIDLHGDGIAFVGGTGLGKSTLVASFGRQGMPCLSDDGLALSADGEAFWIAPGHPSLRLWDDSHAALLDADAATAPLPDYTAKARFLASDALPFCASPRRLARIYLLSADQVDAPAIDDVSEARALIELVSHSFVLETEERAALAAHFDAMSAIVARVPCHRLRYPRRYADLPRARDAIVAHARQCTGARAGTGTQ